MAKVNEYGMTFKPRFQSLQVVDNTRYPVVKPLKVTENGEYAVPEDVDGFSPVKVAVPLKYDEGYSDGHNQGYSEGYSQGHSEGYNQGYDKGYPEGYEASQETIILQEKTTEDNGEITADNGFTGLSKVIVNVPKRKEEQEKTLDVTENGSYEVFPDEGKALSKVTANVNIPREIDALVDGSITEYSSDKITRIDRSIFFAKDKLTKVIAPNVVEIEDEAFRQCYSLVTVELSPQITKFANNAFNGDKMLEMSSLPDNITSFGESCFRDCAKLQIDTIPASVAGIWNYAFAYCTGLTNITFKGKAEKMYFASTAFQGCNNLLTINVPWAEGEVQYAPWGATKATINYNYTEGAE